MELDIFEVTREESSHISTYFTTHNNEIASTSGSSQYIFRLPKSTHWRNFANSHFEITARMVKSADNSALADLAVSTVCGTAMALFKNFDIFVGDKRVLTHELHSYTSYFENKWSLSKDVEPTWPALAGWFPDQHGKFDDMTDDGNHGFKSRRSQLKNDWDITYCFRPNVFPFCVEKVMPPDVEFRIEVERSSDAFMLLAATGVAEAKLVVSKISLVLENVVLNPSIESNLLSRIGKFGAMYEFTQVKMQSYFIPKDVSVFELTHHQLIWPTMPAILLMTIVSETAYIGHREKNPYSMKHCNVTDLQIKVNGSDLYHGGSLKCDFAKSQYISAYKEVLSTLEYANSNVRAPTVTYRAFDNDNVFFAANIQRKFPHTIGSPSSSQDLSIVFTFSANTAENQRLLIYPTYQNAAVVSGAADERTMHLMHS